MKTSAFIVGTSAILAAAGPVKRAYETEWVTDYVTVCVTEGQQQAAQPTSVSYAAPAQPDTEDTNVYTVWVQSEPETTQAPEQYTTWYTTWGNNDSGEKASTTSTSEKAKETTTTNYGSGSSGSTGSSSSGSASSGYDSDSYTPDYSLTGNYSQVMINYHNAHRWNHSAPIASWNDTLAESARKCAETCVFEHRTEIDGGGYGQNIASWGSTDAPTGAENKYGAISITNQWYNSEVMNYESYIGQANPPSGLDLDAYGHFTQVVWDKSTEVGCYTAYCGAGTMYSFQAYFTVCNYYSPGNYADEYGNEVKGFRSNPLGYKSV